MRRDAHFTPFLIGNCKEGVELENYTKYRLKDWGELADLLEGKDNLSHKRAPTKSKRLCGKRSRSGKSDFSRLRGKERYEACGDEKEVVRSCLMRIYPGAA